MYIIYRHQSKSLDIIEISVAWHLLCQGGRGRLGATTSSNGRRGGDIYRNRSYY